MRGHAVVEAGRGDVPVAAEGVAARLVVGLPAVVEDEGSHAVVGRGRALGFDDRGVDFLVECVPRGVERVERGRGRQARVVAGTAGKPFGRLRDGISEKPRARVEPDFSLVAGKRRFGRTEEADHALDFAGFLDQADMGVKNAQGLGADGAEPVCVIHADERENGHARGDACAVAPAPVPVRRDEAIFGERVPDVPDVALRNGEGDLEGGREGFLRGLDGDADGSRFAGNGAERELPVTGVVAGEGDGAGGGRVGGGFDGGVHGSAVDGILMLAMAAQGGDARHGARHTGEGSPAQGDAAHFGLYP